MRAATPVLAIVVLLGTAGPAAARPGSWGGDPFGTLPRWDRGGRWNGDAPRGPGGNRTLGPAEGQAIVSTQASETPGDAARLGKGAITVRSLPGGQGVMAAELPIYAAAVVDQLARQGYRTDAPDSAATQVTEVRVARETVVPEEVKKPVSGAVAVGVSNRGTGYGMAVNVDLTKPRAALLATTLEVRIRDKTSGAVLWEGRADINTREDDATWPQGAIAAKLAQALFAQFGPAGPAGPG